MVVSRVFRALVPSVLWGIFGVGQVEERLAERRMGISCGVVRCGAVGMWAHLSRSRLAVALVCFWIAGLHQGTRQDQPFEPQSQSVHVVQNCNDNS